MKCRFRRSLKAVANFLWPLAFCPKHLPRNRYASSCCLCESERRGWGAKEQESPRGDKAALPEAHVNQIRSKDMMSVYRETGPAGPGSSGSRILIIPRRKSGIGLPCRRWKSGGRNSLSNQVRWLERLGSFQGSL